MPRYLSLHTLACLTRQGAEELAARLHAAQGIVARRVLLNMIEGKMLIEFEAPAHRMGVSRRPPCACPVGAGLSRPFLAQPGRHETAPTSRLSD